MSSSEMAKEHAERWRSQLAEVKERTSDEKMMPAKELASFVGNHPEGHRADAEQAVLAQIALAKKLGETGWR